MIVAFGIAGLLALGAFVFLLIGDKNAPLLPSGLDDEP